MAFQTGTVNSLADISSIIQSFLTANGWTWDSGSSTIYKGTIFIKITVTATRVEFRGRTSLVSADSGWVAMGRLRNTINDASYPRGDIVFPATYYAFLNDDEFYLIIKHSTVIFQYVIFGKSTIDLSATGGTGTYLSSLVGSDSGDDAYDQGGITCYIDGHLAGSGIFSQTCAAPFFMQRNNTGPTPGDYVHTGMSAGPWDILNGNYTVGNLYNSPLIAVLPNSWNGESPFLPIRCYKSLSDNKCALVVDLQHARQCRVDNFNDAETITIGPDQWIVFPFYRKNTTDRDGVYNVMHTGTLGWAIRKVP